MKIDEYLATLNAKEFKELCEKSETPYRYLKAVQYGDRGVGKKVGTRLVAADPNITWDMIIYGI